ncbi:cold shock domain-containing protein [Nocardia sp.]
MTTTTASPIDTTTPDPHIARQLTWQHGHVAWWNAEKGFGFVDPDDGGESVFVRHTAIAAPGYRRLVAGQPVVYAVADHDGDKPEALQVLTYADSSPAPPEPPRPQRSSCSARNRWWRRCRCEKPSAG